MPLHVFHCADCHHEAELLIHPSEADSAQHCPLCGSAAMARQLSTFAVGHGGAKDAAYCADSSPCAQMAQMGGCAGGSCPMMN